MIEMQDIISMLHRGFKLNPNLFDPIVIGGFTLSIQASFDHHCSPRRDLPPYMYDEMEIAIYVTEPNTIPTVIDKTLKHKWEQHGHFFSYVTTSELQWIYETLMNEDRRLNNERTTD
jgi:hypothetical protein